MSIVISSFCSITKSGYLEKTKLGYNIRIYSNAGYYTSNKLLLSASKATIEDAISYINSLFGTEYCLISDKLLADIKAHDRQELQRKLESALQEDEDDSYQV